MATPLFQAAVAVLHELAKAEGVKAVEHAALMTKLLEPEDAAFHVISERMANGELKAPFTVREVCRHHWGKCNKEGVVKAALAKFIATGVLRGPVKIQGLGRPKLMYYAA